jgi:V8-like Glu-specific endopeptidase
LEVKGMVLLSAEDRTELLEILVHLPILQSERGREAILESANLQQLRPQLDLSGEPVVAVPLMIKAFCSFGRLTYEHEALGRFLSALRDYVGLKERKILENSIAKYNLMTPSVELPIPDDSLASITTDAVLEKIIGENTLRAIAFLQQGLNVSRSVAYIEVSSSLTKWSGTGFMISPCLLMTNHHVLPQEDLLSGTIFRFNYQLDTNGNAELFNDFVATQQGVYYTNKALDYAVVELMENPGGEWGYLTLKPVVPLPDSRTNIIQHPNGLPKQISMQNNFVKFASATKIQYVTSTLPGSSGSPVFDDNWKVIGIHHAGGRLPEERDKPLYFRNEAIAMRAVLEDMPEEIRGQITISND